MANLDEYQRAAAETTDGSFLVLAGPGSGKTTTLLTRVKNLMDKGHIAPEKICLVTFTRDAAEEMSLRFFAQMEGAHPPVGFFTFHSLFFSIIKEEYGLKDEDILMGKMKKAFMKEALRLSFPEKKTDSMFFSDLSKEISIFKNGGERSSLSVFSEEDFHTYVNTLDELKKKYKKTDFDDMQYEAKELLSSSDKILRKWRDRYSHYMVDEAQDMNRIQYDILKLLTIEHGNVFLVGDDDQSIYSFRGADPTVLMRFEREYKGCRKLYLKKNYRSDALIVRKASNLIKNNRIRFEKEYIPESKEEGRISYTVYKNEKEEAEDILRRILSNCDGDSPGKETAVLFRNNYQANAISSLLKSEGIKNVSLHTFHGAKGLEWDTVYILDVNEGITPSKKVKNEAALEEERRMFYVAMTRARHRLFLCAIKRSNNTLLYPSRYLLELSDKTSS